MGNRSSSSPSPSPSPSSSSSVAAVSSSSARQSQSQSYYGVLRDSYTALVHAIIRPPRAQYRDAQLGPARFSLCGREFCREDFALRNARGLALQCSLWQPVQRERASDALPCVIYLHGNSSSRLEALSSLSLVLSLGACLLALDLSGSGRSDGEFVSLGEFEKDDLQTVIEALRASGRVSSIALWGRSMGAVTALLHAERDPSIAGLVLDSAFADLLSLAQELVEKGRAQGLFAPNFVVKLALQCVRNSVQKAAHFDIKALSPIDKAENCFVPAKFVCASHDSFVSPSHSRRLYEKYGGEKDLCEVEGDHNSPRPLFLYHELGVFLQAALQIPQEWVCVEGFQYVRKLPWSVRQQTPFTVSPASLQRGTHALTLDEQLVLQLMQDEERDNEEDDAESAMMRNVERRILGLLGSSESERESDKHSETHTESASATHDKTPAESEIPTKMNATSNTEKTAISPGVSVFRPPPPINTSAAADRSSSCESLVREHAHVLPRSPSHAQQSISLSPTGAPSVAQMMLMRREKDAAEREQQRRALSRNASPSERRAASTSVEWVCDVCTLRNPVACSECEACGEMHHC